MGPKPRPVADRIWDMCSFSPEGCFEWIGATDPNGYALIGMKCADGKWRPRRAHRVAWELVNGPIPEGMDLCHECDNRLCVNVDHLFIGTRSENMLDCVEKGRSRNQWSNI